MILAYIISNTAMATLSVAAPMITVEYGCDNSDIGLLVTIGTALRVIPKFATGFIVDQIGGKTLLIVSTFLLSIFTIAIPFYPTLWWMGVLWALVRVIQSLAWPSIVKIIAKTCPANEMGKIFSFMDVAFWCSLAFLQVVVTLSSDWKMLFYSSGVCGIIVCAATSILVTDSRFTRMRDSTDTAKEFKEISWKAIFSTTYSNPKFWCLAVYYGGMTIIRQGIWDWILLFLTQTTGCSVQYSVTIFTCLSFVGFISTLMFGVISDRNTPARRDSVSLLFGILLTVVLFLIASLIPTGGGGSSGFHLYLTSALLVLAGFFLLGPWGLPVGVMTVHFGGKQLCGTVSGTLDGLATLASLSSGFVGAVSESPSGWQLVYVILTLISALSTVALFLYMILDKRDVRKINQQ